MLYKFFVHINDNTIPWYYFDNPFTSIMKYGQNIDHFDRLGNLERDIKVWHTYYTSQSYYLAPLLKNSAFEVNTSEHSDSESWWISAGIWGSHIFLQSSSIYQNTLLKIDKQDTFKDSL